MARVTEARAGSGLAMMPAMELRRLLLRGELSPVEVLEASLERVSCLNGTINAVVTLNPRALEEAREVERRGERGLLYGLPVGIKDVTPVAGVRTTYGSPLYRDH